MYRIYKKKKQPVEYDKANKVNSIKINNYATNHPLKKNELRQLAVFIVKENGAHHNGASVSPEYFKSNVDQIHAEDLMLYESSAFYLAIYNNKIIGSVKVSLWDGNTLLPIEKLFGINCKYLPFFDEDLAVWHVGRLAISKENPVGISLLRQLLTLAIYSICEYPYKGIMVAECDKKLLKVLNLLGIKARALAPGIEYLGSETIPVYSTTEWLNKFLTNNEQVDKIMKISNLELFERSILHRDPEAFDEYLMYMSEDTCMVKVLIYRSTEARPRNDKFIFTVTSLEKEKDEKRRQEQSGFEIEEKIQSVMQQEREKIATKLLRKELAETEEELEKAEKYIAELEKQLVEAKNTKISAKENFGEVLSLALESMIRRNTHLLNGIPLVGQGLADAVEQDNKRLEDTSLNSPSAIQERNVTFKV